MATDQNALEDRLVSRKFAAEFLDLSTRTLAAWAVDGFGPSFVKMSSGRSGAVRYRMSELERFASNPVGYRPRDVAPFRQPAKSSKHPAALPRRGRSKRTS